MAAGPDDFDPALHAPVRLKLMLYLAEVSAASHNELRQAADVTDGNLATHLKVLVAAGYVVARRGLIDLRPRVRYSISEQGARALSRYAASLLAAARRIQALTPTKTGRLPSSKPPP